MKIANKEGKKALDRGDYPAGCVITKEGKILSRASSASITKNDPTAHAEILAIKKACKKLGKRTLEDCAVYANIEPCLMCAKAMVYAGIRKVVYGTKHLEYGNRKTFDILKENGIAKGVEATGGLQGEKASGLLKAFLEAHSGIFSKK